MKPPRITLHCDCGAEEKVAYGQQWTCGHCGRRYDTTDIPAEDYSALLRIRRRYQMIGWALASVVALFVLLLAIANHPLQILAGLPIILLIWFVYVRPVLRRRYRRALASRPKWELRAHPQEDPHT